MMEHSVRLDIAGPKGNVFYILGLVKVLGKRIGLSESEQESIQSEITGEVITSLGGSVDYVHVLRTFKKYFPFVQIYSRTDLGLPEDVCEIIDHEVMEL